MKTNKKKKILISLDNDLPSHKVANTSFSLAKYMDAEVILLHVIAEAAYNSSLANSPILDFPDNTDMDPAK